MSVANVFSIAGPSASSAFGLSTLFGFAIAVVLSHLREETGMIVLG
jgi:hypothetical protein